jgi:hypothetical protein
MRWHWLIGATVAVGLVACGDSNPSDKSESGGTSSSKGGRGGSGGISSSKGGRGGSDVRGGSGGASSSEGGGRGGSGGTSSDELGGNRSTSTDTGGTSSTARGGSSGGSVSGSGGDGNGGSGGTDSSAGGAEEGGTGGTPAPSTFTCAQLGEQLAADTSDRKCYDFSSSGDAAAFTPDGGTWAIVDGAYVCNGPSGAVTCVDAGSMFTASTLSGFSAADVRVHAKMTSLTRVDKVLVLRSRDSGNRIELNFRASFESAGQSRGSDLVIQELVDCQYTERLGPGVALIPHTERQTIEVVVELRGQQIKVTADGNVAYNNTLPVTTAAGSVGCAVIFDSVEMFDDFVVETLK